MGFEHGDNDPCIFVNKKTGLKLVTVVDDILMRGNLEQSGLFYREFEHRFKLKDPTYLTTDTPIRYVGFDITMQEKSGKKYISIDQDDDIRQFLGGINMPSVYKVISGRMTDCQSFDRKMYHFRHSTKKKAIIQQFRLISNIRNARRAGSRAA